MPPQIGCVTIGPHDHDHRIPSDVTANSRLDGVIPGCGDLLVSGDGIYILAGRVVRQVDPRPAGQIDLLFNQEMRPLGAGAADDGFQCLQPFSRFYRICVRRNGRRLVGHHGHCFSSSCKDRLLTAHSP